MTPFWRRIQALDEFRIFIYDYLPEKSDVIVDFAINLSD